MKPVLLDTGVTVALLDRSERFHEPCAEAVRGLDSPLVTCKEVIAESCYLIRLAHEFETPDILTLDEDFQVYRWGRNKPFHILLDLS